MGKAQDFQNKLRGCRSQEWPPGKGSAGSQETQGLVRVLALQDKKEAFAGPGPLFLYLHIERFVDEDLVLMSFEVFFSSKVL